MARLIGWREWVELPELGIRRLKAKADTGARTSALHAVNIHLFEEANTEWVEFNLGPDPTKRVGKRHTRTKRQAKVVEQRVVKDSGGREELRVIIKTEIKMADQSWPIEISLTDRATMGFRMLLGRTALASRFMIDPSESYLLKRYASGDSKADEDARSNRESREEE